MDGVSHVPRSNAGDSAQAALLAEPANPTATEPMKSGKAEAAQPMPLMHRTVLDAMLPSMLAPGLAPHVAEVDAIMRIAPQAEPAAVATAFADQFLAVDKASFGTDADPLGEILDIVAAQAQPPFYAAFESAPDARLSEVVGRIRNWMVAFLRRKEYYRTGSALTVLVRLPLHADTIRQVKLQAVVRRLEKEPGAIGATAKLLVERFPDVFAEQGPPTAGVAKKPAPVPPKLFGNVGLLKLGTHKRPRDASPEPAKPENQRDECHEAKPDLDSSASTTSREDSDAATAPKRVKKRKTVHWRPDNELVAVRLFEMETSARFKSAKNARQQEHDEGSAMHQGIDWGTPKFIDFTDVFRTDFQAKMSSKRGGHLEPDSDEARVQAKREARVPMAMYSANQIPDSPKEPQPQDAEPDPSWRPRQAKEPFTGAPVPAELRHKYEKAVPSTPQQPMGPMAAPFMNPMTAAMVQLNPMMAGFQFGGGFPMNMNMNPAQMSEMMAKMGQSNMNMSGMYGFQGTNPR